MLLPVHKYISHAALKHILSIFAQALRLIWILSQRTQQNKHMW